MPIKLKDLADDVSQYLQALTPVEMQWGYDTFFVTGSKIPISFKTKTPDTSSKFGRSNLTSEQQNHSGIDITR